MSSPPDPALHPARYRLWRLAHHPALRCPTALLIDAESALSLPAFDRTQAADFLATRQHAMQGQRDAINALVGQPEAPDFANVVAAFDRSGALWQRIESVFYNLAADVTVCWGQNRERLRCHARHAVTDAVMPAARLDDLDDFEAGLMAGRARPTDAGLKHRLPQVQHLLSNDSQAARHYVYPCVEVLEADARAAFTEAGSGFDPALAARLKACIVSRSDNVQPGAARRVFSGRDARIEPMLRERGWLN